eukprot:CAMPEP_0175224598 /NCGR_PEP_ID=MMETSP0093-20121207/21931_1 /TAXON_ID=311494 /ORGANISM="Alexandrium monilatum, Strain CCMP3105" /LENGTH=79 /DNA_ID=CAMNT_0016518239 /DNA_START=28 /DNA_END=263 /DNA_ORIENTATION=-
MLNSAGPQAPATPPPVLALRALITTRTHNHAQPNQPACILASGPVGSVVATPPRSRRPPQRSNEPSSTPLSAMTTVFCG